MRNVFHLEADSLYYSVGWPFVGPPLRPKMPREYMDWYEREMLRVSLQKPLEKGHIAKIVSRVSEQVSKATKFLFGDKRIDSSKLVEMRLEDIKKMEEDRKRSDKRKALLLAGTFAMGIGALLLTSEERRSVLHVVWDFARKVSAKTERIIDAAKVSMTAKSLRSDEQAAPPFPEQQLISAEVVKKTTKESTAPISVSKVSKSAFYSKLKSLVTETEVSGGRIVLQELRKGEHRISFVTESGRTFYFKPELKKNERLLTPEWLKAWTERKLKIANA